MRLCTTIIAALAQGQQLPEWYLIFAAGESEVEGTGRYLVDRQAWEEVQARIARRGIEIVVDYEHQTIAATKAPAAGWVKEWRYREGVGIEARIEWTEEAQSMLGKNEYRYYSPVFYVRDTDRRLAGIHSVALTNAPRTNHLKPLLAKLGALEPNHDTEEDMELLKQLIAKLGLKEDATEDQVLQALGDLQKNNQTGLTGVAAALGLAGDADASTVVAAINVMKQEAKTMVSRSEFDALAGKLAQRDAEGVVAKAMSEGKITPDQQEWAAGYAAADLAGFKQFVAKAPVVVPMGQLPKGDGKTADGQPDQATLTVAKMMGISTEEIAQFGK